MRYCSINISFFFNPINMDYIDQILNKQKSFFFSNSTKDIAYRVSMLKKLKNVILQNEKNICDALYADLRKSYEEAYLTEISIVLSEINYHLKNINEWSRPKNVHTPLHLLPSRSKLISEPLGTALIIAPWNYPFQLVFNPLVGAISAGCTAVLKPSNITPTVSALIAKIIKENFDESYIAVVEGSREENTLLLQKKYDIIFFTGSPAFGKAVMEAAAKNLCPVILELGGKSPCIVDESANIKIAARRIMWGKLINAGQTCIAPDYVYVHENIKSKFIEELKNAATKMYGNDFKKSNYYPRIVSSDAFNRLTSYLKNANVIWGAEQDAADRFISPTLINQTNVDDQIMKDEIFGPILPILSYSNINTALTHINSNEKPLALYYFGKNSTAKEVISKTSSGGVCVNDTLLHIANHHLPFGGVGNSGMGKYHGEESFFAFSNRKPVLTSPTWIDLVAKYPPFKWFSLIKRVI